MVDEPLVDPNTTDSGEGSEPLRRELCPVSRAICMLEKKWTIHILYELSAGKRRFCHLQDAIGNANSRTLSERLKELELQGLIHRDVIQSIPPWVEYSLTEKGTDLCRLIEGVADWARKWSMFKEECWSAMDLTENGGNGSSPCAAPDRPTPRE
ncbi:MAG: helix-turn-helix transcriptional regulator [Armatimonadetes bacterium]|nr:helix-turn-helix transcriptional regulator [Armatimonadota bacterium]